WGHAFSRAGNAPATDGTFNGLWAAATVQGVRYTLSPPDDVSGLSEAVLLRHRGGYLLELALDGVEPLGFVALRPRLHPAAADLGGVTASLEAGGRRDRTVRDAVLFSAASNVFGAVWGFRGQPGVERASHAVYVAALATLADGWARLHGGERPGVLLKQLIDP